MVRPLPSGSGGETLRTHSGSSSSDSDTHPHCCYRCYRQIFHQIHLHFHPCIHRPEEVVQYDPQGKSQRFYKPSTISSIPLIISRSRQKVLRAFSMLRVRALILCNFGKWALLNAVILNSLWSAPNESIKEKIFTGCCPPRMFRLRSQKLRRAHEDRWLGYEDEVV